MFGLCVVNSEREVSAVGVSCWGKLGLDFIGNGEPSQASELRNGVRAALMRQTVMIRTIAVVRWYLILIECFLFANCFSNYLTHRTVFNLPTHPKRRAIIIPTLHIWKPT